MLLVFLLRRKFKLPAIYYEVIFQRVLPDSFPSNGVKRVLAILKVYVYLPQQYPVFVMDVN